MFALYFSMLFIKGPWESKACDDFRYIYIWVNATVEFSIEIVFFIIMRFDIFRSFSSVLGFFVGVLFLINKIASTEL